jgi:hypothetical protein
MQLKLYYIVENHTLKDHNSAENGCSQNSYLCNHLQNYSFNCQRLSQIHQVFKADFKTQASGHIEWTDKCNA